MVMSHQQAVDGVAQGASSRGGTDEFANKVTQLLGELRVESDALQRESTEIEMLVRQSGACRPPFPKSFATFAFFVPLC